MAEYTWQVDFWLANLADNFHLKSILLTPIYRNIYCVRMGGGKRLSDLTKLSCSMLQTLHPPTSVMKFRFFHLSWTNHQTELWESFRTTTHVKGVKIKLCPKSVLNTIIRKVSCWSCPWSHQHLRQYSSTHDKGFTCLLLVRWTQWSNVPMQLHGLSL